MLVSGCGSWKEVLPRFLEYHLYSMEIPSVSLKKKITGIELIYNVVLHSAIQQSKSVIFH